MFYTRYLTGFFILLILLFTNVSYALNFTVSDINFTNISGNSADVLNWWVRARNDFSFDLDVGERKRFTYGYFRTNDFPINTAETNDLDDAFTANFSILPSSEVFSISASPVAGQTVAPNDAAGSYLYLQFASSTIQQISFGDGGLYSLEFLGAVNTSSSISRDVNIYEDYAGGVGDQLKLQARLTYDVAPVPEPGTFVLLGAGLVGLAYYRRKRG